MKMMMVEEAKSRIWGRRARKDSDSKPPTRRSTRNTASEDDINNDCPSSKN
jgi:hypothetical protein